jgi:GTP pyrophosphokinase
MVTVSHRFHDVDSWLAIQKKHFKDAEVDLFRQAIDIAVLYYKGQKFYPTNVDLMLHALTCANTVSNLNLYADAVLATILFSLPKFCPNDWQDKLVGFEPKVIELIEGVNRVTQIRKLGGLADVANDDEKRDQIEVIRKMLLAMVSDIRVVLIVLVGRGELMLNLKSCKDSDMVHKIALETVEIFAPLANRLGVWQIKWELEDLSFKYMHPEQYKKIAKLLDETREERLEYIENIKTFLSMQMEEDGITEYQIMGRAKHLYSIWKKMKKKNYDFENLYDIRAVRILVPEVKDCYTVLGIVHTRYSPIPGEFDDYISNPKPNNYQSLHTCVVGPDDKVIEIQIRTFAMHNHAEYGVAAHWRYKESEEKGIENNSAFIEKIAWLRQILDWREDFTDRKDIRDIFKNEIFNDTIYVMTPQGKVISLPKGSTAIDFAYAVHSAVGHKCRGAKVDGQIIPLSTPLNNGQKVEILTVKNGGPSISWLHDGWVKSSKAISHIRRYIRYQDNEEFLSSGEELLDRERSKIPASNRPSIAQLVAGLNYDNEQNVYIDLGKGDLSPITIRAALTKLTKKPEPTFSEESLVDGYIEFHHGHDEATRNKRLSGILVDGITGIVTCIAKCCKPLPGDDAIGFVTQGKGVAIHRTNCVGLKRQAKLYPNKVVQVDWGDSVKTGIFNADIEVVAHDRAGLLRDLTNLFASEKLNINGLRTVCRSNKAIMLFTIQLNGGEFNFSHISSKLFGVDGVQEVLRK